ncbi:hypothetical protein QTP88_013264 [Uroleucon formosanum]
MDAKSTTERKQKRLGANLKTPSSADVGRRKHVRPPPQRSIHVADRYGNGSGPPRIRLATLAAAQQSAPCLFSLLLRARSSTTVDNTLVNSASTSGGQSALGTSAAGSVGFGFRAAHYSCGSSAVLWCASFVSRINT